MLSTVAERLYWAARYLERVENTARLVKVYTNLILDLPDGVNVGWYNLVELNSCTETFEKRYKNQTERNVVKFLLADDFNFNSMMSALNAVRENIRTSRDEMPVETWEQINELHLYVKNNVQKAISRSNRHEFLDGVIQGSQQVNGLLSGTMSQDAGWEFLRLGRNLERADMTTRILDAGIAAILQESSTSEPAANFTQIVWGNVLSSLSAYVPYRKAMRTSVKGEEVTRFLIEDTYFPRSMLFCLNHMQDASSKLPRHDKVVKQIAKLSKQALKEVDHTRRDQSFRDYINDLQIGIADLHWCYAETWFPEQA
ncbi:MAG: alpha-E domain-containing protein [Pseudomonadales bacterium]|nr:alpha-E domain-containing protein [Pseudomonadales bacterium]